MIGLSSAAVLLLGCSGFFLSGNGSNLVESFFDRVFWVSSSTKKVGHFLSFFFEVCIVLAQTTKSKKLGERDAVFGTGVVR